MKEEELDNFVGSIVNINTAVGPYLSVLLVKSKHSNTYGLIVSEKSFCMIGPSDRVISCSLAVAPDTMDTLLDAVENPKTMNFATIAADYFYKPIKGDKPIPSKIMNKVLYKPSSKEVTFFFPKDGRFNDDGTLKYKGPFDFI